MILFCFQVLLQSVANGTGARREANPSSTWEEEPLAPPLVSRSSSISQWSFSLGRRKRAGASNRCFDRGPGLEVGNDNLGSPPNDARLSEGTLKCLIYSVRSHHGAQPSDYRFLARCDLKDGVHGRQTRPSSGP